MRECMRPSDMDPGLMLRLIVREDGDVVVAIGRSPRGLALMTEDGTDAAERPYPLRT